MSLTHDPVAAVELDALLRWGRLRAAHQPIVDLERGDTVAYEALLRPPADCSLRSPGELFAAASAAGRLAELDWAARAAATVGVEAADGQPVSLLVNVEPATLGAPAPAHPVPVLADAVGRTEICVEMTERALVDDPARLIAAAQRIKQRGWRLALDDVGADPASLALLPFLRPDVIKLDLNLVREHRRSDVVRIVDSVRAEAERTGAVILAEGIETAEHLHRALTFGAHLGQGYLFGRPELDRSFVAAPGRLPWLMPPQVSPETPAAALADRLQWRTAEKRLLLPISLLLENRALTDPDRCVVLASFQHSEHFDNADTTRRYTDLGRHCSFVSATGVGLFDGPAGVRGTSLDPAEPLVAEWNVVVVGPHFAGALVATDLGDTDVPDANRRFRYAVTHDREQVLDAARHLLARVRPEPEVSSGW